MKLSFFAITVLLAVFQVPTHGQEVKNLAQGLKDVLSVGKNVKSWKQAAVDCLPFAVLLGKGAEEIVFNGIFGYERKLLNAHLKEIQESLNGIANEKNTKCVEGHRKITKFIFRGFGTDTTCLTAEVGKVVQKSVIVLTRVLLSALGKISDLVKNSKNPETFADVALRILKPSWPVIVDLGIAVLRIVPNIRRCRSDIAPVKEITSVIVANAKHC